jgi:hypothetical protein
MRYKVLIVGAGQLGSRYLQGLAKVSMLLDVVVSDVSSQSLARAKARWQEAVVPNSPHQVRYVTGLSDIPSEIDLAIIATSADVRPSVVSQLAEKVTVHYWVLEKVLAQSEADLDVIISVLGVKGNAWVNTPRRMMGWFREFKVATPHRTPTTCTIDGFDWGLACNAVHYLDFLVWWTGEQVTEIQTDQLAEQWHSAKRPGNWEVYGTLIAKFSEGSELVLHCKSEPTPRTMILGTVDSQWLIHELDGIALRSDGLSLPGRLEFQSEMTGALVESILSTGRCNLTSLSESVALHRPLLQGLLAHWRSAMPDQLSYVPIT